MAAQNLSESIVLEGLDTISDPRLYVVCFGGIQYKTEIPVISIATSQTCMPRGKE
jgi:hypothetical protein